MNVARLGYLCWLALGMFSLALCVFSSVTSIL
jgi:hypothetical protein